MSAAKMNMREQILWDALDSIKNWRRNAIAYDKDMGHQERTFCGDVELIEGMASRYMAMYEELKPSIPAEQVPSITDYMRGVQDGILASAKYCRETLAVHHPTDANLFRHAATNIESHAALNVVDDGQRDRYWVEEKSQPGGGFWVHKVQESSPPPRQQP